MAKYQKGSKKFIAYSGFCCNKPRRSRFCPECGNDLSHKSPLHELLAHILKNQLDFQNRLENHQLSYSKVDEKEHKEAEEAIQRSLAKWKTWSAALKEVIAEQEAKKMGKAT